MATISLYNHVPHKANVLDMDANAANFKVMLLNNSASFDATHTTLDQVSNTGAYEVSGNGWTAGGMALSSVTFTQSTGTDIFDAADLEMTPSGGDIGPAYNAVIYLDEGGAGTTKSPIAFIAFGGAKTATLSGGGTFKFTWPTGGIIVWSKA